MLEIDKLEASERQAAKDGEAADIVEELRAELVEPEGGSADDVDTEEDPPAEDTDSEPEPAGDTADEAELATESLRHIHMSRLAMEDMQYVKDLGGAALSALGGGLSYLGRLGIQYGPIVLKRAYKGVSYAVGRIAKMTYMSFLALSKYIERRQMAIDRLETEISKCREGLTLLVESDRKMPERSFDKDKLVAALAIGDRVDFTSNIDIVKTMLQEVVLSTERDLLSEIHAVERLSKEFNPKTFRPDSELVTIRPPRAFTVKLASTVGDTEYVHYRYKHMMPGNRLIEWRMPKLKSGTTDIHGVVLDVQIRVSEVSPKEPPKFMTMDELSSFLDKLEGLCSLCREQQKLYTMVKARKSALRGSLRLYFNKLFLSNDPVSIGNSMLDIVYMRSALVDKVYLVGLMDVHDAVTRILSDSVDVVKHHLRNYQ